MSPNAIAVLSKDHRELETMCSQLDGADTDERATLVGRITQRFVQHASAEEQWLYPAARLLASGHDLARRAIDADDKVLRDLKSLERQDNPETDAYQAWVLTLVADLRHHIAEAEEDLFVRLPGVVDPTAMQRLGRRIEKSKRRAPTRPHPYAPTRPPANRPVSTAFGVVDRLRDRLARRN